MPESRSATERRSTITSGRRGQIESKTREVRTEYEAELTEAVREVLLATEPLLKGHE